MTDSPAPPAEMPLAMGPIYYSLKYLLTSTMMGDELFVYAPTYNDALKERDELRKREEDLLPVMHFLRTLDAPTLAWLQELDRRPFPQSDEGALFTYHGMACVLMPEDDLRKLEAERDALRLQVEGLREALKRYGTHDNGCSVLNCSCGLHAAEKGGRGEK